MEFLAKKKSVKNVESIDLCKLKITKKLMILQLKECYIFQKPIGKN